MVPVYLADWTYRSYELVPWYPYAVRSYINELEKTGYNYDS